jgi:hypothetical protein
MKHQVALLAAFAAASLTGAANADGTRLNSASIHDLFPGYYEAEVYGGYTLLIAARANGRLDGKAFGRSDKGEWQIVGDRLCVLWMQWTSGEAKCGRIMRTNGWYVAYSRDEGQLLRFKSIGAAIFTQDAVSAAAIDRN